MTRCQKFYDKMKELLDEGDKQKLSEFCNKAGTTLFDISKHIEFMEEHLPTFAIANISEGATRPLRSQSPDIQEQVLPRLRAALQQEHKVTTPQVRLWITEAKYPKFRELSSATPYQPLVSTTSAEVRSIQEEFCPICPKRCDETASNCPVTAFLKWDGRLEEDGY